MELFDFGLIVLSLRDLVEKHARQAINCLPLPCRHLRWMDFVLGAISCAILSPRSASSATVTLNLSEKLRLFVICVSCGLCWIHLNTLYEFAGPLHLSETALHTSDNGNLAFDFHVVLR